MMRIFSMLNARRAGRERDFEIDPPVIEAAAQYRARNALAL